MTTLIFDSGKAVCTGAKTIDDVHDALSIVVRDLRDLGIDIATDPPVDVQNIVCSASLEQSLKLNAIAIGLGLEDVESRVRGWWEEVSTEINQQSWI